MKKFVCFLLCVCLLFSVVITVNGESDYVAPPLSGNIYTISTEAQLRWVSGVTNGKVAAGTTNYPSDPTFSGYTISLKNSITVGTLVENDGEYVLLDGKEWLPIGTESIPFSGVFQGNEMTVKGVSVNGNDREYNGFFGCIDGGTVENLTVKGYICGNKTTGGIVGKLVGAVNGCLFVGRVDGIEKTGGIVGEVLGSESVKSKVYLSVATCNINTFGGETAGGIAGFGENADIISCSGGVELYSYSKYSAGILGLATKGVTISCCNSEGTITADGVTTCVGGILGASTDNVSIINVSFSGSAYSSSQEMSLCGGIGGSVLGKIENSYVNGGVYSALYFSEIEPTSEKVCVSAGIVAESADGTINNCYFSGISECEGQSGYDVFPEGANITTKNLFYSQGIAYKLYGTDNLYHVVALLDELKKWVSSKGAEYSLWQSVSGINEAKPLHEHKNVAGSNGVHAWKAEGTVFTFYTDGEMDDYSENKYGMIDTPWAVYRPSIRTVNIKEGVTRIGNNAFGSFDSLRTLKLPSTLNEIGDFAFEQCINLRNFIIPSTVSQIGEGAFRRCINLTEITIPNGVTTVRDSTFAYCEKLAKVNIPNTVLYIGYMAFSMCDSLANVNLPQSVKDIESYAFYYCDNLETVSFPSSLRRIGSYAFGRCDLLVNFDIPDGATVESNVFWSTLQKGDMDGDGQYTIFDYLKVKASFLGVLKLSKTELKLADSDFDGKVTATDYLLIKRRIIEDPNV